MQTYQGVQPKEQNPLASSI